MDFPNELDVSVTQDDLDQGRCFVPGNCPVARAVARGMNQSEFQVTVSTEHIFIANGNMSHVLAEYRLPSVAQDFVKIYDRFKDDPWISFRPFTFAAEKVEKTYE